MRRFTIYAAVHEKHARRCKKKLIIREQVTIHPDYNTEILIYIYLAAARQTPTYKREAVMPHPPRLVRRWGVIGDLNRAII